MKHPRSKVPTNQENQNQKKEDETRRTRCSGPNINYDTLCVVLYVNRTNKKTFFVLQEEERVRNVFLTFYISVHPHPKNQKCCLKSATIKDPCRQNTYKDTHTNTEAPTQNPLLGQNITKPHITSTFFKKEDFYLNKHHHEEQNILCHTIDYR